MKRFFLLFSFVAFLLVITAATYYPPTPLSSATGAKILLSPPTIGTGRSAPGYNPFAASPGFVFISGQGIVKDLWIVPDIGGDHFLTTTNGTNIYLQVFCDQGSQTNNATSTNMSVDISLAHLFGDRYRFPSNGPYNVVRQSEYWDTQETSTNMYFGSYVMSARLKAAMPYTNSIVIRLFDRRAGTVWQNGYMTAFYETGVVAQALGSYASWRLRTATNYGVPSVSGTNRIINRVSTGGMVIGLMGSYLGTNGTDFTDTVQPVFMTETNVYRIASGYSDLFNDPYSLSSGPFIGGSKLGWENGWVNWYAEPSVLPGGYRFYAFETYRCFTKDAFTFGTNGLQVYGWGLVTNVFQDLTVWYYAP